MSEPRDPATVPTPAQWVDEFLQLDPLQREDWAERIIDNSRVANRCFTYNHDATARQLRSLLYAEHPVCLADKCDCHACVKHRGACDVQPWIDEALQLRATVEKAGALAAEWDRLGATLRRVTHPGDRAAGITYIAAAKQLRDDLIAGIEPLTESGEALDRVTGQPATTYTPPEDVVRPAPAPSGGQADGEGRPDVPIAYRLGALADWCDSQRTSPTTADLRALAALAASTSARPVLSREALRRLIVETVSVHLPQSRGTARWPGCYSHPTVVLADVLAGGEQA